MQHDAASAAVARTGWRTHVRGGGPKAYAPARERVGAPVGRSSADAAAATAVHGMRTLTVIRARSQSAMVEPLLK